MTLLRTFALAFSLTTSLASASDLTITVSDVHDSPGAVFVAIYDSDASFMKPPLAKVSRKVKASKGRAKFVIHDLPAGRYAVASFHDENGNGKLDRNSLGVPSEGFGFSNDAQGTAGPPTFAQAAFDFDGKTDKAIGFSLNY